MRGALVVLMLSSAWAAASDVGGALSAQARDILQDAYGKQVAGKPYAAANAAQKAGWLAPNDPSVRTQSAYLQFMSGDAHASLEEARLAAALGQPRAAELELTLALAYHGSGDVARGRAALKRAARKDPRVQRLVQLSKTAAPLVLSFELMLELTRRFNPPYVPILEKRREAMTRAP